MPSESKLLVPNLVYFVSFIKSEVPQRQELQIHYSLMLRS